MMTTLYNGDNSPQATLSSDEGDVLTFTSDGDGSRLDAWLAARCAPEISRSRIQTLIEEGRVLVDGAKVQPKTKPAAGANIIVILPPPLPAEPEPEDIPLDVVYEDSDIILVNKPAGLVVHPAPGHASGTLVNALLFHCHDLGGIGGTMRPGIVHRLDKDTTGLLVVAKHEAALNNLAMQFQTGRTEKIYLALVHGCPDRESGTVRSTIGRHPTDRKRMAVDPPHGKSAVTHYKIEKRLGPATLLRVRIETGRTHQIRVHLAHVGFPIVGDQVYGKPALDRKLSAYLAVAPAHALMDNDAQCCTTVDNSRLARPIIPARQMLHATSFSFDHPADGRRMQFSAPPPADMAALIRDLEVWDGALSVCK